MLVGSACASSNPRTHGSDRTIRLGKYRLADTANFSYPVEPVLGSEQHADQQREKGKTFDQRRRDDHAGLDRPRHLGLT